MTVIEAAARRAAATAAAAGVAGEDVVDDPANWVVPPEFQARVDTWAASNSGSTVDGGAGTVTAAVSGKTGLPLASRDTAWDKGPAVKRLTAAGKLADGHFWRDPDGNPDAASSYKLPFADVIGGRLTAVPQAIVSAAGAIQGARGGTSIPAGDVAGVKARLAGYYRLMGMTPPWEPKKETASMTDTTTAATPPPPPAKKPAPPAADKPAVRVGDTVELATSDGAKTGQVTAVDDDEITVQLPDGTELKADPAQVTPAKKPAPPARKAGPPAARTADMGEIAGDDAGGDPGTGLVDVGDQVVALVPQPGTVAAVDGDTVTVALEDGTQVALPAEAVQPAAGDETDEVMVTAGLSLTQLCDAISAGVQAGVSAAMARQRRVDTLAAAVHAGRLTREPDCGS